jgi:D-arginine dehydrogenase
MARVAASERWPMVACAEESFYFKPEGAGLLVSPADETPVAALADGSPIPADIADRGRRPG